MKYFLDLKGEGLRLDEKQMRDVSRLTRIVVSEKSEPKDSSYRPLE